VRRAVDVRAPLLGSVLGRLPDRLQMPGRTDRSVSGSPPPRQAGTGTPTTTPRRSRWPGSTGSTSRSSTRPRRSSSSSARTHFQEIGRDLPAYPTLFSKFRHAGRCDGPSGLRGPTPSPGRSSSRGRHRPAGPAGAARWGRAGDRRLHGAQRHHLPGLAVPDPEWLQGARTGTPPPRSARTPSPRRAAGLDPAPAQRAPDRGRRSDAVRSAGDLLFDPVALVEYVSTMCGSTPATSSCCASWGQRRPWVWWATRPRRRFPRRRSGRDAEPLQPGLPGRLLAPHVVRGVGGEQARPYARRRLAVALAVRETLSIPGTGAVSRASVCRSPTRSTVPTPRRGWSCATTQRSNGSTSTRSRCLNSGLAPSPKHDRTDCSPGRPALTIQGTRHRAGEWEREPVATEHDVAFTVFIVCRPSYPHCYLLRHAPRRAPPVTEVHGAKGGDGARTSVRTGDLSRRTCGPPQPGRAGFLPPGCRAVNRRDSQHLSVTTTVCHTYTLNHQQLAHAATIITVGDHTKGVGREGVMIALMAALTESTLRDVRALRREDHRSADRRAGGGDDVGTPAPETSNIVLPPPAGVGVKTGAFGVRVAPDHRGDEASHRCPLLHPHRHSDTRHSRRPRILRRRLGWLQPHHPDRSHRRRPASLVWVCPHVRRTDLREAGEPMTAGQHIADIGMSGYTTGPHLHSRSVPEVAGLLPSTPNNGWPARRSDPARGATTTASGCAG
jgi:hypothetical protein